MAYNVAANLRPTRPGQAFLEGRDRALGNALAERQVQNQEQQVQFNQNRLVAQDQERAAAASQQGEQDERSQLFNYFSHLSRLKANPQQYQATASKMLTSPLFQKYQIEADDLTPDQVDEVLPYFAAQSGQAPAPDPVQYEQVEGPRGAVMQRDPRTGELKQVVGPDNSQPSLASTGRARVLSRDELAAYGLPEGTVAQELPDGRIDVVNKREGLSAAEQKVTREAKMRMPRLNAALRRVDRLGEAVDSIAGNRFYNGGPADAQVLKYTKQGQEVNAAAAQLMPELQALTRVPGIGSQSDLEARLASLALPSLEMSPEVNRRSQAELRAFVEDLKAAYASIIDGGQPQEQQAAPASQGPVRVNSPQEAAALPSGTQFITPDGRIKVRP